MARGGRGAGGRKPVCGRRDPYHHPKRTIAHLAADGAESLMLPLLADYIPTGTPPVTGKLIPVT